MNVKFSKGHLTPPKPKSENIEKSIGSYKKMVNMFFVAEDETFLMMIILVNRWEFLFRFAAPSLKCRIGTNFNKNNVYDGFIKLLKQKSTPRKF